MAIRLFLYVFLIVITDPYKGINYNEINVYDVNYCSDYCYNQNRDDWAYFEEREEEIEELEDEYRDKDHYEENDKPLIFNLDDWINKK
jgi:hypothetical protein